MRGDRPETPSQPNRLTGLLFIGPVLLFVAATAHGILEVHSSTDTWIGLAAGHQIFTADEFPKTDTFSFTFNGEVWYNQNWLTHLYQYWLYSTISPNAVVYGTWALSASVFVLTLLAAYWRSGTWLGAFLAASVVGLGCRDFLSARPATTGFFCIASLWALICALEGQRDRRRWWPIALLLPLLLVWGNAHGSFVFGYGVLAAYVGYWFFARGLDWCGVRRFRPQVAIADRQVVAIVGVVIVALILTVAIGPFGIENFTHGGKVAGSEVFRRVSEWNPPFLRDDFGHRTLIPDLSRQNFPPMLRFWLIFGFSALTLLATGVIALLLRLGEAAPASERPRPHVTLFDAAMVIIGLAMTFWARRFAPIYFIFGAPVILTWIVLLLRPLPATWRPALRLGLMSGAGLLALFVTQDTWTKARRELIDRFKPPPHMQDDDYEARFDLLDRVTRYDATPHNAILFLKMNNLHVNVLTEWTQAGPVMFHARNAKVFMDGRSQQVYSEQHYQEYARLMTNPRTDRPYIVEALDRHNTTAVMLRRGAPSVENMWMTLEQSPLWIPALLGNRSGLFLRRGSRGLEELGERLRNGEEWRPNSVWALASRGFVWQAITPPDLEQAIGCWQAAIARNITVGIICFRPLTRALLERDRAQEARQLVEGYFSKLNQADVRLPKGTRDQLLRQLRACWNEIEAAQPADPEQDSKD